jgi:hypothetical protein
MKEQVSGNHDLPEEARHFKKGRPRVYRVEVEEQLDASWSVQLAGLKIAPAEEEGSSARTIGQ